MWRGFLWAFLFLSVLAEAEEGGGRRYRRGGYDDRSQGFPSGQTYSTQSAYRYQNQPQGSRFGNSHDLNRQYYAGRASGGFIERGAGERYYAHGGDPRKVAQMNAREADINRFHESYVDQMHRTLETKADNAIFKEKMRARGRGDLVRELDSAEALLNRNMDLYRDLHSEKISGRR